MNKSIVCIPFPGIENAYVVISGKKADGANGCEKAMTFFYGDDNGGAEWEPDYGPIKRIIPCKKDDKEAKKHWFYDYYSGPGHWSQLAVNKEYLPEMFLYGNYKGVFEVLKAWSK